MSNTGKPYVPIMTLKECMEAEAATLPVQQPRWTDEDLYNAYLTGCEDECLPEPFSKTMFLVQFTGGK